MLQSGSYGAQIAVACWHGGAEQLVGYLAYGFTLWFSFGAVDPLGAVEG
jgi:hypothetical protein